jgi:spermidine synthase
MYGLHLLFKESTDHDEILVYETSSLYGEKGNFRVLQFSNEHIQGAMDLNNPKRIVLEYPRAIIHLMEFTQPSFDHIFIIGHGIGTIASHLRGKRTKVAELDEKIVEVSRRYFGYDLENVRVGDGRSILSGEQSDAFDMIIVDAFTDKGTPLHLVSQPFFEIAKEKLHVRGSIIMNLMGKGANDRLVNAIYHTLNEVFDYAKVFILPAEGSTDMHNIIIIGRNIPIGYQARHMAGFVEFEPGEGYMIRD